MIDESGIQHVAEEELRRHALASQQRRRLGRVGQPLHRLREAPDAHRDESDGRRSEGQEEYRLERVDPRRALHAAEEDVAHDDGSHDQAAEPVRHHPAADRVQRRAAAHHRDDDVGHQQRRLHREDGGPDMAALPAVAVHLHRGHEAEPLAERPDPGAEQVQRQGNDQCRRRAHQPVGHDAVGERVARRPEDRERRHVRAEEREQEDVLAERSIGQEIAFRPLAPRGAPEREDADVEDDAQVEEDDERRDHGRSPAPDARSGPPAADSASASRWAGHANRTSTHISPATASE